MFGTGSSFQLARVLGIRIGVNVSWFIVLFLFIYLFQGSFERQLAASDSTAFGVAVVAAVLFFGSILLHELGHAIAARREGIEVTGIELFLFGGVMKMSRDTDSPGAEFRVAAAGPLVTLLIVVFGARADDAARRPRPAVRRRAPERRPDRGHPDRPAVRARRLQRDPAAASTSSRPSRSTAAGSPARRPGGSRATAGRRRASPARLGQGFAVLLAGYGVYIVAAGRPVGPVERHARLAAGLRGARRDPAERGHRPPRGHHGRRPDGRRAGDDPRRHAGRAGLRGLLPALPGLGVVRGRRRRRALRRDRPPRAAAPGGRGRRPAPGRRARGAAGRRRRGPRRRAARGAARAPSRCGASAR